MDKSGDKIKIVKLKDINNEVIANIKEYAEKKKDFAEEYEYYKSITDTEVLNKLYEDIENEKPTYHKIYTKYIENDLKEVEGINIEGKEEDYKVLLKYIKIRLKEINKKIIHSS